MVRHYGVSMDPLLAAQIAVVAASLLGTIIVLLLLYMVIRLAVTHSLRSHHYWMQKNSR